MNKLNKILSRLNPETSALLKGKSAKFCLTLEQYRDFENDKPYTTETAIKKSVADLCKQNSENVVKLYKVNIVKLGDDTSDAVVQIIVANPLDWFTLYTSWFGYTLKPNMLKEMKSTKPGLTGVDESLNTTFSIV